MDIIQVFPPNSFKCLEAGTLFIMNLAFDMRVLPIFHFINGITIIVTTFSLQSEKRN